MRIKHIFTKDGEPMANPEMELPFAEELLNIHKNQPVPHGYEISKQDRKELEKIGLVFYYQDDDLKAKSARGEVCSNGGTVLTEKGKELILTWHSGLLPFEKQIEIRSKLPDDSSAWDGIELRRDTLIPVDLEVGVGIIVCDDCPYKTNPCPEGCSKKVLRIKP